MRNIETLETQAELLNETIRAESASLAKRVGTDGNAVHIQCDKMHTELEHLLQSLDTVRETDRNERKQHKHLRARAQKDALEQERLKQAIYEKHAEFTSQMAGHKNTLQTTIIDARTKFGSLLDSTKQTITDFKTWYQNQQKLKDEKQAQLAAAQQNKPLQQPSQIDQLKMRKTSLEQHRKTKTDQVSKLQHEIAQIDKSISNTKLQIYTLHASLTSTEQEMVKLQAIAAGYSADIASIQTACNARKTATDQTIATNTDEMQRVARSLQDLDKLHGPITKLYETIQAYLAQQDRKLTHLFPTDQSTATLSRLGYVCDSQKTIGYGAAGMYMAKDTYSGDPRKQTCIISDTWLAAAKPPMPIFGNSGGPHWDYVEQNVAQSIRHTAGITEKGEQCDPAHPCGYSDVGETTLRCRVAADGATVPCALPTQPPRHLAPKINLQEISTSL